jgi:hypothetical protein
MWDLPPSFHVDHLPLLVEHAARGKPSSLREVNDASDTRPEILGLAVNRSHRSPKQ